MLDVYLAGEVRRISPEAPVPVVEVKRKDRTLGSAGNVALNVVGLACQPVLVGVRGNNLQSQLLADIISKRSIIDNIIMDPSRPTTTKIRVIAHGQQLVRLDEEQTQFVPDSFRLL